MNDLLKSKLTPNKSNQRWLRITVDDGEKLRKLVEWWEAAVSLPLTPRMPR